MTLPRARRFPQHRRRFPRHDVILSGMVEINRALSLQIDSETVWDILHDQLNRMFDTTTFFVALFDRDRNLLNLPLVVDDGMRVESQSIPNCGVSRAVINFGVEVYFRDLEVETERLATMRVERDEREPGLWTHSWMGVPLRTRSGDVSGLISLQHVVPRAFDDDDLSALMAVASSLSLALDNLRLIELERERRLIAEALTKIGQLVSQTVDYDEVLERLLDQFQRVIGYTTAAVLLVESTSASRDNEAGRMVITVSHDPDRFPRGLELTPADDSPPARSGAVRQPIIADLVDDTGYWWKERPPGGRSSMPTSWLIVPMITQENMIGQVLLGRHGDHRYTQQDASTAFALARQGAITLENTRLYMQSRSHVSTLQLRSRRLASLYRITGIIGASLQSTEVLNTTAQLLTELFDVDHCGIILLDVSEGEIAVEGNASLAAEYPNTGTVGLTVPLTNNPTLQRLIDGGETIAVEDVDDPALDEATRDTLKSVGAQSTLIAPLVARDRVIGSIGIDMIRHRRTFSPEDREMMMTIASQVAMAITNARLYEQALAANRLKSAFLATISHELRTPLNAIIGYSDMLLGEFYGTVTEQQRDRIERVNSSGKHLLSLIDDVLDLSKIEAGQITLARTPMRISDMIEQVVNEIQHTADDKKLTLTVRLSANEPHISADPRSLRQIITNLLHNAIKFTHEGGVAIHVQPVTITEGGEAKTADVETDSSVTPLHPPPELHVAPGDYVALTVRDTGIGIEPSDQAIIFDSFRQVDNSTVREYGGTGLGLAISMRLVHLQEGYIWVESEIDKGSAFTVLLPIIPVVVRAPSLPVTRDGRALVLVIDDDLMTLQLITDFLPLDEFQVNGMSDPTEALEWAKSFPPDVVITDVMMPRLSGWDVMQSLKTDSVTATIPVIIVSILDQKMHGLSMGAAGYLVKPIDRSALLAQVRRVLPQRESS